MSWILHTEDRIGEVGGIRRVISLDIGIRTGHHDRTRRNDMFSDLDADRDKVDLRLHVPRDKEGVLYRPDGVTGLAGDEGLIARLQDIDRCPRRDPFRKFAFAVHDEDKLFLLDQVVDQFLVARECREKCDPDFPLQDAFLHGRRSLLMEFQPHMGESFLKTRV